MCVCVSDVVDRSGRAGGGGRSGAALKTETPHVNVGKNITLGTLGFKRNCESEPASVLEHSAAHTVGSQLAAQLW